MYGEVVHEIDRITRIDEPPRGGACKGHDPRMWYPHASRSDAGNYSDNYKKAVEDGKIAKRICAGCSKKIECLSYALYHEGHGIWGGKTERERNALRRLLKIQMVPKEPFVMVPREQVVLGDE
jgi:hypothetical protein